MIARADAGAWDDGHTALNGAVTLALWTPAEWASGLIERTLR